MSYQELSDLLTAGVGIPFAFHHWDKPPAMPFGVYFDDRTDNFEADNIAYYVVRHFVVELYVRQRDPALEELLEGVLDGAELAWDKDAVYIDDERAYQISYEIEV